MVYIASHLRGDYEKNTQNAIDYCAKASEKGVLPLAPHIIFSQWCHDTDPELRDKGLQLGLELLSKSDELWVCGKHISEGMQGEIELAKELGIPMFHIRDPHDIKEYPQSLDGNIPLSVFDTIENSNEMNYKKQIVIYSHAKLKEEFQTQLNQIWLCTHGPGCGNEKSYTGTVHLTHPVDGDKMSVHRSDILGIAKPEVVEKVFEKYGVIDRSQDAENENSEEMCV